MRREKCAGAFSRAAGLISLASLASSGCGFLMTPNESGGTGSDGGVPTSTAMTRMTHEKYFPIASGPHEKSDCNSCHGGFSTFKQFTCTSCHDHAKDTTDTAHAGVADYKYDSASCLSCHPSGVAGEVSRVDHTKYFPIDVGTPHASGQCTDCHTTPGDKSQFTCLTCHDHAQTATDAAHQGITDYKYQSPSCLSCHPSGVAGELARPDHKKFFPIEAGTAHGTSQCTDCHTTPGDKSQFTCIACHDHEKTKTDGDHKSVASYKYDSPSCYSCHKDGSAAFDHATLPSPPNCISCHQADLAKAVTTPASLHVTNKFPNTCESCHKSFTSWGPGTAMDHMAVGGTAAKCETCHLDNQKAATKTPSSNHLANNFPITCGSCHKSVTAWGPATAMPHQVVGGSTAKCETCHLDDFTAGTTPFNHTAQKVSANTCNMCHTDVTTWTKFVHNPSSCFNGSTLRGHQGATCAQCHTVASDYSKSSCTACHQDRGTNCND